MKTDGLKLQEKEGGDERREKERELKIITCNIREEGR